MNQNHGFKKWLENQLVKWLTKIAPMRIQGITVGNKEIKLRYGGYIPDDFEWHHAACSVSFWLKKQPEQEDDQYAEVAIFSDGKKAAEYRLDNPQKESGEVA